MSAPDPSLRKDPSFIVRSQEPYNAGPPSELLVETAVTPIERFYVRNHGPVPELPSATYRLRVHGEVEQELDLGLDDLRSFPSASVTATLQCAGNRRDELARVAPTTGEVPWGAEAIGTATWTGVRLRDVLHAAGVRENGRHVAALGADEVVRDGRDLGFGGSVPLRKALSPETLLATGMNGEPLPPVHGAPLRLVVPGYIGARSVKWLRELRVQESPSTNHFQARSYRLFPASSREADADWGRALPLGETSVNAVICSPRDGERGTAGGVRIRGYATAGGERTVARVDVSVDGGATWRTATLDPDPRGDDDADAWSWRLWQLDATLPPGRHELVVRAWDTSGNTQPERLETVWNFKGYLNTAWHRRTVDLQAD